MTPESIPGQLLPDDFELVLPPLLIEIPGDIDGEHSEEQDQLELPRAA